MHSYLQVRTFLGNFNKINDPSVQNNGGDSISEAREWADTSLNSWSLLTTDYKYARTELIVEVILYFPSNSVYGSTHQAEVPPHRT